MKQKTGKKLLSFLLALVMVVGLLPGLSLTALAWDGNPYADLVPTGSEDAAALTAKQVTFNGKQWYVIKDASTAENAGTLTLLYAGSLGNVKFDKNGSNVYANSSIKTALGNLTTEDGYYYPVAEAIKDTENGKLYLLSVDEANQVPLNVRKDFPSAAWWLRTPAEDNKVKYVFVNDTVQNNPGRIVDKGVLPTESAGVRPALQLDLSKVVFDSTDRAFYIPATAPTDVTVTGATLLAGYGAGSVSVTATAAGGHTLSYQWYSNTTNSNQNGTKIEGATSATYNIPTGNVAGGYYYYCIVTATRTDNSQTASVTSPVATVTVAADTDELVATLAEEKSIDLSQYYLIPAEDMYFTSEEYWNFNSSWEKLPDEGGEKHVATKQFTKQGLPSESLIFCKAYYSFEAVAWESSSSSTGQSGEIGKRYNLLTTISDLSDQFDWWDNYSFFGFNLTKYAEGDFNTKEEADLSSISDAFRIYVPKPADAAEVSETKYPTVADAIRAAGEGDTVKLLRDVTENVVLRAETNIVLDLNGHKLTNDGRHCTIVAQNGSTLVVTDSSEEKTGTVDNTTHGCAPLYNNGGTVTLNGGTFIRSAEDGNANGGNTYYTVVNRGTMTINEGVTVSNDEYHYSSLIANGYNELTKTGYREIDPKVSSGYVAGESAANPTLTINGGTFTGGNQALKNDVNGVATIKGGSFSSTAGNAIKNLGELTISGGTFTAEAEGKFALYSAAESGKTYGPESVSGSATVTGGTFIGKLQEDEGATIEVSGGEFSEKVPENCCKENYYPSTTKNSSGKYFVHLRRSSGGGGTSTVTTSGSVAVKVSVSGTTATVAKLTDEQLAQATENKSAGAETQNTVAIDVSGVAKDVKTAVIPTESVKAVEETGSSLQVTLTDGSVEFDTAAEAAIADAAKGSDIRINLDAVSESGLNAAQQTAVKEMDVQIVVDAYITSNGERIGDFKGGSATVSIPYTLKDGQTAGGIVVWYVAADGARTQVPARYDGKNVMFTVTHFSNYVVAYDEEQAKICPKDGACPISAFTDADAAAWYHDGVHWAIENGVMNGVGDGRFAPNATTTRAEVATMLYRLAGSPAASGGNPFADVAANWWYSDAICWAAANGIVTGYDGKFAPDAPVTREQLATMLYRYAQYKKMDVSVGEDTNILSYDDAFDISEYAVPAMQWACGSGVVNGIDKNGTLMLAPSDASTRAVVATMFWRFSK